jgi:hypothetical protein
MNSGYLHSFWVRTHEARSPETLVPSIVKHSERCLSFPLFGHSRVRRSRGMSCVIVGVPEAKDI